MIQPLPKRYQSE